MSSAPRLPLSQFNRPWRKSFKFRRAIGDSHWFNFTEFPRSCRRRTRDFNSSTMSGILLCLQESATLLRLRQGILAGSSASDSTKRQFHKDCLWEGVLNPEEMDFSLLVSAYMFILLVCFSSVLLGLMMMYIATLSLSTMTTKKLAKAIWWERIH